MKKLKKIGVWVLLSLFVQTAVLLYLDKFYFVTETNFKATRIDEPTKPVKVDKDIEIKVPNDAKNISLSFDGSYLAYYENQKLYVVNTINGKKSEVSFDKDIKSSYYEWLPDVNSMFIAEKKIASKSNILAFSNYDAEKDKKKEIAGDNKGNQVFVNLPDKDSQTVDIQMSRMTFMIYVKVNDKSNRGTIYSMNRMAQTSKLKLSSYNPGKMLAFPHQAQLAYEDITNRKVWITGANKPISIKGAANLCLVGTDDEDKLYIGQVENNKVKKIYYGATKDSTDKWNSVDLKTPVNKEDIFVMEDGNIYTNNKLKGTLTNIATNKEISYKGEFLQIYNSGAACIADGKLYKIGFDEKK